MALLSTLCALALAGCASQHQRPAPTMYDPFAVSTVNGVPVSAAPGGPVVVETMTTYSTTEKKPGHNAWADWNFSTDRDRMTIQRYIDLPFPPMPQPHSDY